MPPDDVDLETATDLLRIPPFHKYLGVDLVEMEAGRVVVRMPYKDELIGNPTIPALHGGILAALMDLTGGVATFAELGIPTPTIDLRIDYIRPALARDHLCEARIVNLGRTVAFVDVTIKDENEGKLVAEGRVVYSTKNQDAGVPEDERYPIG